MTAQIVCDASALAAALPLATVAAMAMLIICELWSRFDHNSLLIYG